jgi:hypothetical protein
MTMQQPGSHPFYMDTRHFSLPTPWSSVPFHLSSQSRSPFILPQQQNPFLRKIPSSSSFSNTRYHHLKQSTSYSNRRPVYRSVDASTRSYRHSKYDDTNQYRSSKTKSISDLEQISSFSSTHLPKAHSWHTMAPHRPSNFSVAYAKEMQLTPKRRRKPSPQKKKRTPPPPLPPPPPRHLSSSPKRKPSFNNHRKRSKHLPERGVVRISTLDEMPVVNNQIHKRPKSINNDRLSMKGSISNSSKRRIRPKENNSIKNRKIRNNEDDDGKKKI